MPNEERIIPFSDVQDDRSPAESKSGSFWLLVGAGCVGAIVWAVAYAALQLWCGVIFFLGMLLPVVAGGLVAATVVQASKWMRIPRGPTTVRACIVCGLLGWYAQWVAWLALASGGVLVAVLPWDLARVLHLVATEAPLELWILNNTVRVVAAERYVLWTLEAALWVGTAWGVGGAHWSIGQALRWICRVFMYWHPSRDDVRPRRRF